MKIKDNEDLKTAVADVTEIASAINQVGRQFLTVTDLVAGVSPERCALVIVAMTNAMEDVAHQIRMYLTTLAVAESKDATPSS